MRVIFLDIDGVLSTIRYIEHQVKNTNTNGYKAQFNFDPLCMQNLKQIIDKTDAKIVISSTWRLGGIRNNIHLDKILNNLNEYGLKDKVIGYTPDLSDKYGFCGCRGYEIQKWLDDNKDMNIKSFVILDDDTDMFLLTHKLIQCHHKYGLNREAKTKAINMLIK